MRQRLLGNVNNNQKKLLKYVEVIEKLMVSINGAIKILVLKNYLLLEHLSILVEKLLNIQKRVNLLPHMRAIEKRQGLLMEHPLLLVEYVVILNTIIPIRVLFGK